MKKAVIAPFQIRRAGLIANLPYHSTPGTRVNDVMLTVFLAGRGVYRNSDGERIIKPNMVGLVPPDDPGILMADPANPYTHYYCRFNGEYAIRLARRIIAARGERFFPVAQIESLADMLRRIVPFDRETLTDQMEAQDLVLAQVLVALTHPPQRLSPALTAAALEDYLRERLAEPHDLARMARHFHLSKATLCRRARQLCGRTVVEMSEAMKIEWAQILLKSGSANIGEAARRVGYEDPFYFSRVFKKHTGQSPRHWIKPKRPPKGG